MDLKAMSDAEFQELYDKVAIELNRRAEVKTETMPAPDWSGGRPSSLYHAIENYRKQTGCALLVAMKVVRKFW